MVRAMCGVHPKDSKRFTDLMRMLGLCETLVQLAMANSVRWYEHLLRREDSHVLIRAMDFEVEDRRKKGRPNRIWKKQTAEESVRRKDALCRS